ncbi:PREDICTED: uncharacterized protein LOC106816884, partial [Priapulus caudatus]|uniref:Uncharacterized protein LOC106816884 n=1 Tax=Priapulus caudatus TaxID=37621 RepID=A0ABM1EXU1_PRICU
MPFTVVVFGDETVDCVPTSWLERKKNKLMCYWPGGKQVKRRIVNQEIPDKNVWLEHEVRIIGKSEYQDYKTACIRAKRAEETSNVDSDEGKRLGKNKKPQRYQSSAYETSGDDSGDDQGVHVSAEYNQLEIIDMPSAPELAASKQNESSLEDTNTPRRDLPRDIGNNAQLALSQTRRRDVSRESLHLDTSTPRLALSRETSWQHVANITL